MDSVRPHRPRVSRETRLLLTTAFLAVAALWGLARVRFPDRPSAPNPVQPILTQLAARPALDDLAAEIGELQPRLAPLVILFDDPTSGDHALHGGVAEARPALRVRPEAAVVLLDRRKPMSERLRQDVIGLDPASGLAVVRVPSAAAPAPVTWLPGETQQPRYLIASDVSTGTLALRPVFVGSLVATVSPVWPDSVWTVPEQTELAPGSFVFTSDARLAGLVVEHGDRRAIVPGRLLLAEADRLLVPRVITAGYAGIEVQSLTPVLARATGASSGVVVTWVDPMGPAAATVVAGDVLEAANNQPVVSALHWDARAARLTSGERVELRIRRSGQSHDVTVVAAALRARQANPSLGLTLQSVPGTGAIVTRVEPGSASEKAGILAGDVIRRIGDAQAPTPGAIRRAFAGSAQGQALLVALTRGGTHHVMALEKP